ncbi:MAG: prolipoprotein diacylglyceryl transferase [Lachnospiraceae bacterium]|nr:prolipoprotein diacylglyceryl transferase [Lachnospiraceae bacterium]
MHNDLFSLNIFGKTVTIHGYGLMIAIGIAAAIVIAILRARKKKIDPDPILDVALIVLFAGFLGGKIMYIIVDWKEFIKAENKWGYLGGGGFVVYGGIILVLLACAVYFRIRKMDFFEYFDLIMPEVSVAQGFGRIGCFLAGCCYGSVTDSPLGVVFPPESFAITHLGEKIWPTQLFMSIGNFAIAGILLISGRFLKKKGQVGSLYLILYAIGRFVVEFFRDDPRGSIKIFFMKDRSISTSQFISIFVLIAGIALFIWRTRAGSNNTKAEEKIESKKEDKKSVKSESKNDKKSESKVENKSDKNLNTKKAKVSKK